MASPEHEGDFDLSVELTAHEHPAACETVRPKTQVEQTPTTAPDSLAGLNAALLAAVAALVNNQAAG